ncbi:hypothetical protein HZA85_03310 [Candidatus Uhrbacteria bacterium]|nr:hypothetical protein [Candidatus Uhrbacteria bacterium]
MSLFDRFHKRVHESLAISALLAAAVTMHIGWMSNLLIHRSTWAREQFTIIKSIGPISGLYLKSVISFILLFGIFVMIFRARDCSHWRDRALWFFIVSAVLFLVLTLPIVYSFSIQVR